MLNNGIIKSALIISFVGHGLFLGIPGNHPVFHREKQPGNISLVVEIEEPSCLPRVENMGDEKKLKETVKKDKIPPVKPVPEDTLEEIITQPAEIESEEIKIINPDSEAILRYQDMVKQKIEEARRYPLWAKKERIEGAVELSFVLLPDGLSRDVFIIRSSGRKILDQEALDTIRRAGPFPSIPPEINTFSVKMEVSVVFSLKK